MEGVFIYRKGEILQENKKISQFFVSVLMIWHGCFFLDFGKLRHPTVSCRIANKNLNSIWFVFNILGKKTFQSISGSSSVEIYFWNILSVKKAEEFSFSARIFLRENRLIKAGIQVFFRRKPFFLHKPQFS